MTELTDLIARIEAATRADRELDDAIANAIYTGKHRCCIKGLSDEAGSMWMFTYPNGSVGSSPRFTGSIGAALTLAPEGWTGLIPVRGGRDEEVWLWPTDGTMNKGQRATAATPALALCAAALKAMVA